VIYGTENGTDYWYDVDEVDEPDPVLWAHGKPTYLSVQGDDAFEKEEGDDLIPVYSTNLRDVLDSIPQVNVAALAGDEARHKQIMYHPQTQSRLVPTFLIGQTVPFTTTYQKPVFLVDPRQWLVLTALCPVDLTITDPQGRRAGYDPATGEVLEEIPDAVYASPGIEGQFIVVPRALAGDYQVNATGFDDGEYTLLLHRVDEGGAWLLAVFTGTITAGQTVSHTLSGFTPSIFADSFDRPDSSDLGPGWEEVAGEFDIVDGQLHATADGQNHLLLTTQTFTDTQFILESRFRGVLAGWPQAFDQACFLFGADASGQGGYRVVYAPLQGQVLLYRDDVLLDSASIVPQLGRWYQVQVERDGVGGGIAIYLDEGQGYPTQPLLEAVDATYPALGRLGAGGNAQGFDLYTDWVTAMPWEGAP